jgi:hypothetical protein
MFFINFTRKDDADLRVGRTVKARVNGEAVSIRKESEYLCYTSTEGEQRCKILKRVDEGGQVVHYACASHGQDANDCYLLGYPE